MTTIRETIVWRGPDEEPPPSSNIDHESVNVLVQYEDWRGLHTNVAAKFKADWYVFDGDSLLSNILRWAELPKGEPDRSRG